MANITYANYFKPIILNKIVVELACLMEIRDSDNRDKNMA